MLNSTELSDTSVTVRWNEPPMDIDIASYRIEYRVIVDQLEWMMVIVKPPVTNFMITGLRPLATYEVRIFAISVDNVTSVAAKPLSITTGGTYVLVMLYLHVVLFCSLTSYSIV